jgi:DNA polymerase III alpha subunit
MPDNYKTLDVLPYVLSLCTTPIEVQRVQEEYKLFKERDLDNVLRFFIYLVSYLRENRIVWGVGRGSSVASYILFLIGVHKIDSIRYSLDIKEFLK